MRTSVTPISTSKGTPSSLTGPPPSRCPWSYDVAYFLVGALSVNDRKKHDRELVNGYLDALEALGGPALDRPEAWKDYQRHTLHGLIWATLPPTWISAEQVQAMTERYVSAIVDHDPFEILGV